MSWDIVQLKDYARIVGGATPKSEVASYWNGDIPWTTPKDLSNLKGKFLNDTPRKITEAGLKNCSSEILPPNSVLFSSRAPIGHVAINLVPIATNQGFKSMIPGPKLDASFLYWWLKCHRSQLELLGNGATFKEVSKTIVEKIEIPLPPLDEQKRIAGILDQADALRTKRKQALTRLNQLGQAIFVEMFGDLSAASSLLEALGTLTTKIGSGSTPRGGDSAYKSEGTPLIRSMNVRDGHFTRKGLALIDEMQASKLDNVIVQPGDVLLNITGASVARVCAAPMSMKGARVNQHVSIIRPTERLLGVFLEAYLLLPMIKKNLLTIAEAGATRQAITKAQIEQLRIPVPAIRRQIEFADRLRAVQQQQNSALVYHNHADILFTSLQHRAFRGEL